MAKKIVAIDVDDKNLVSSKKSVKTNAIVQEKKEIENFGIVEINNASATKKIKKNAERGFEKNVSGETKKSVKTTTSHVEDYFDFSFRKNEKSKTETENVNKKETKPAKKTTNSKVTSAKTVAKKSVAKTENNVISKAEAEQIKEIQESVCFDSDANHVIRVARIGSLFDCDIRMMNA